MSTDYIVLSVVAVLAIGGGLYLLAEAKTYHRNHHSGDDGNNLHHVAR